MTPELYTVVDAETSSGITVLGFVRNLPQLETWLDGRATSWLTLPDREYTALVGRWSSLFGPLIEVGLAAAGGSAATWLLRSRLPCDVFLFSGLPVPRVSNTGGLGAAGYRALGLTSLDTDLANGLELIVVALDFRWCRLYTHEADSWATEELYERAAGG